MVTFCSYKSWCVPSWVTIHHFPVGKDFPEEQLPFILQTKHISFTLTLLKLGKWLAFASQFTHRPACTSMQFDSAITVDNWYPQNWHGVQSHVVGIVDFKLLAPHCDVMASNPASCFGFLFCEEAICFI